MDLFYYQENCTKIKILNTKVCNDVNKSAKKRDSLVGEYLWGHLGQMGSISVLEINI